MSLQKAAREVLRHYPLAGLQMVPLPGGFSGTSLWRVTALGDTFCLRAWPTKVMPAPSLVSIHRLMNDAKELPFVPKPIQGRHYQTVFPHAERVWDLTTWMPGTADFSKQPSQQRIESACTALAQLHLRWSHDRHGPCPAVKRRFERWRTWNSLVATGWKPHFLSTDPIQPWAERAWELLALRVPGLPGRLEPWLSVDVPVQPCLCDVWHDHVLFTGDAAVTGIIDFGSVKFDNVAADLARMLGSMVGDDPNLKSAGLAAYERVRPLTSDERRLIPVLDETGTVLGAANWLRWLYHEQREYKNPAAVADRLAALVRRMEG